MEKILKIWDMTWFHVSNPSQKDLSEISKTYNLHEIVLDDINESNTQDKIDIYDDFMFLVLHYPKFNNKTRTYFSNEFNIILWKDFIITLTRYHTNHIDRIRKEYFEDLQSWKEDFKVSPYYILYVLIDVMYDKVLDGLIKFNKDLSFIESGVFKWKKLNQHLIEKLLIKRRNSIVLKHIMLPQEEILEELNKVTIKKFKWELDVYFEDLQYKQDKIMHQIAISNENTETLSDTYNSLMSVKTNSLISVLTIFTAIIWIMTFITGLYGMNIVLPGQELNSMFSFIVSGMWFLVVIIVIFFARRGWL